jgi:hypothetical protein
MPSRSPPTPPQPSAGDAVQGLLTAAVQSVPAARYATACVGVAAAVALVLRSTPSASVAVLGGVIMLVSMVLISVIARLARGRDRELQAALRGPTIALVWGAVCATIVVLALLISTTFWGQPSNYRSAGQPERSEATVQHHGAEVRPATTAGPGLASPGLYLTPALSQPVCTSPL